MSCNNKKHSHRSHSTYTHHPPANIKWMFNKWKSIYTIYSFAFSISLYRKHFVVYVFRKLHLLENRAILVDKMQFISVNFFPFFFLGAGSNQFVYAHAFVFSQNHIFIAYHDNQKENEMKKKYIWKFMW